MLNAGCALGTVRLAEGGAPPPKKAEYERWLKVLKEANFSKLKIAGLTHRELKRVYEKHSMEAALKNAGMREKEIAKLKPRELKRRHQKLLEAIGPE